MQSDRGRSLDRKRFVGFSGLAFLLLHDAQVAEASSSAAAWANSAQRTSSQMLSSAPMPVSPKKPDERRHEHGAARSARP